MLTREQYVLMGPAKLMQECERLERELAEERKAHLQWVSDHQKDTDAAWREVNAARQYAEERFRAGMIAGLASAQHACEHERLEEPQVDTGDQAYELAIDHCINAIIGLRQTYENAAEGEGRK